VSDDSGVEEVYRRRTSITSHQVHQNFGDVGHPNLNFWSVWTVWSTQLHVKLKQIGMLQLLLHWERERLPTFSRWSAWSDGTVSSSSWPSSSTDLPWLISASRNSWWQVC